MQTQEMPYNWALCNMQFIQFHIYIFKVKYEIVCHPGLVDSGTRKTLRKSPQIHQT